MSQVTLRPGNTGEILPIDLLRMAEPSIDELNSYMDNAVSFVAELDGAIIGVCLMTQVTPETIELKNVSVIPEYRAAGVGRSLISYAADMARDAGCLEIIAGIDNSNAAGFIFLQKLGFDLDSIEKGYYSQHGKVVPGSFNLNAVHRIWFLRQFD
jgi:ribosomal protein S18 acetylase RimI-like enzyme